MSSRVFSVTDVVSWGVLVPCRPPLSPHGRHAGSCSHHSSIAFRMRCLLLAPEGARNSDGYSDPARLSGLSYSERALSHEAAFSFLLKIIDGLTTSPDGPAVEPKQHRLLVGLVAVSGIYGLRLRLSSASIGRRASPPCGAARGLHVFRHRRLPFAGNP